MKDVAGSGKTPYGPVCGDLARGHSKMFSVVLVLTLIALVAFAAFLVSDIMSNGIAIKEQQDGAIDLANQGKDQEPARLESAAASNSSREGIGAPLSPLNGSEAAKGFLVGGDVGKRPNPTARANSSSNNASTLTGQTAGTAVAIIMPSGSDSHRSDKNKKHSSSKNNIQIKKDIQVNRGASPSSTAAENQSLINQSQNHANLSINMSLTQLESHVDLNSTDQSSMDLSSQSQSSINISSNRSLNLSASEPKMNASDNPSYSSHPEGNDISFGRSSVNFSANSFADSVVDSSANSSTNPDALSQLDTNSAIISDSNASNADLAPAVDFSAKLNISELSSADGETSNLDVNAAGGMEEEVQVEPKVQVELPIQELNSENSVPSGDDEDLMHDGSDEGISDGLMDFNSDTDTNNVEVFVNPVGTNDTPLPPDDVLSEPQYPEHSIAADGEGPVNSQKEPAQFVGSQEDESVKGDLDFAESTSKVVPADKSSYEWQGAENKRISNRDKRDKSAKYLKRPTPPAKPARTKPVKPARENPRDRR